MKAEGVEKLIADSFRFTHTHKGQEYRHAISCEACFRLGLAEGAAALTGESAGEVLIRIEKSVRSRRVVKKPVKKRVVRRKK